LAISPTVDLFHMHFARQGSVTFALELCVFRSPGRAILGARLRSHRIRNAMLDIHGIAIRNNTQQQLRMISFPKSGGWHLNKITGAAPLPARQT
jgi:hypothetical protein